MKWGLNLMGYLDINNYYPTPNIDCTDDEILKELNIWVNNPNDSVYNIIDFERLFYLEKRYQDNDEFMKIINTLKDSIADNYVKRQRMIQRLCLDI